VVRHHLRHLDGGTGVGFGYHRPMLPRALMLDTASPSRGASDSLLHRRSGSAWENLQYDVGVMMRREIAAVSLPSPFACPRCNEVNGGTWAMYFSKCAMCRMPLRVEPEWIAQARAHARGSEWLAGKAFLQKNAVRIGAAGGLVGLLAGMFGSALGFGLLAVGVYGCASAAVLVAGLVVRMRSRYGLTTAAWRAWLRVVEARTRRRLVVSKGGDAQIERCGSIDPDVLKGFLRGTTDHDEVCAWLHGYWPEPIDLLREAMFVVGRHGGYPVLVHAVEKEKAVQEREAPAWGSVYLTILVSAVTRPSPAVVACCGLSLGRSLAGYRVEGWLPAEQCGSEHVALFVARVRAMAREQHALPAPCVADV
jgi:hypothetical protein